MLIQQVAIVSFVLSQAAAASLSDLTFKRQVNCPVSPSTVSDCTYFVCAVQSDTCASLSSYWGITLQEFITYNPVVGTTCQNFTVGQGYCVEENYGNGPAPKSTSSSTKTTKTTKTTSPTSPTTTTPSPTQSGLISSCVRYYKVQSGDTCTSIVDKYQEFSLGDFYSWNPAVGSSCATLDIGYYVCIGVPGTPTQPITRTTTSATSSGPSPEQSGIIKTCNSYYQVLSGDTCQGIADKYKAYNVIFTLKQFYSWNPAVGSDCSTLDVGYYVCVGVSGTTTSKPTSTTSKPTNTTKPTSTAPSPTQTGITKSCLKYYKAVSGDTCTSIAKTFCTFTTATFIQWNPAVGASCTDLLAGDYYCVGISTTPTKCITTTTAAASTTSGPQPQQSGIVADCNKYYDVAQGDTCASIEKKFAVSAAYFAAWNKGINSGCTNLDYGYYVCVGIS